MNQLFQLTVAKQNLEESVYYLIIAIVYRKTDLASPRSHHWPSISKDMVEQSLLLDDTTAVYYKRFANSNTEHSSSKFFEGRVNQYPNWRMTAEAIEWLALTANAHDVGCEPLVSLTP